MAPLSQALSYLTGQRPLHVFIDNPDRLQQLSSYWESIATHCASLTMKLSSQLRFLGLLTLLNTSPSLSSTSGQCDTVQTQASIPSYPVALQEYSYCGGYLNVSVWIQNLNYNKIVELYYADGSGQVTPLSVISLGWVSMVDGTNNGWEYWAAQTPVYVDGLTKLINITYQALDIQQQYLQTLNLDVEPSGPPPPSPPPDPVAYASPQGFSTDITTYLNVGASTQPGISKVRMFDNISPDGAVRGLVTAAQSKTNPDYWYHWVRDAALTMDVVVMLYEAASSAKRSFYQDRLFWYAQASIAEQNDPTAITGLGEPKFNLDSNTAFTGPWGRPQNDGPGARAITLIRFAEAYLKYGGSQSNVTQSLWPAISRDLAYVVANWGNPSFDIWEEESSQHFYNRLVHRRALLLGASFATKLGFNSDAATFTSTASQVNSSMQVFWDPQRNLVLYEYGPVLRGKSSFKDISVVLGVLHGYNQDGVYSYTNDQILASAYQIATSFLDIYPIASTKKDKNGNPLGMPIGRYPEDVYDGTGTSRGNPWYLATAAMAELFYNAAAAYTAAGTITVTPTSEKFWKYFAPPADATLNRKYTNGSHTFKEMVRALQGWGDMWMRTVQHWAPADGRFPEEFDRETGQSVGAADLTWSYASFITAGAARARAIGDNAWLGRVADL
ncbi:glycoside hydrolase 15 protein [Orbilia ellipsospora]|uniref:glucan 1,4-alpha-glucosidase n=1 Tax=Orbilia ellipsospora TaxID=2528407 RepID=A0AAV9XPU1_9PEZI